MYKEKLWINIGKTSTTTKRKKTSYLLKKKQVLMKIMKVKKKKEIYSKWKSNLILFDSIIRVEKY
jgi:hypothetical protein